MNRGWFQTTQATGAFFALMLLACSATEVLSEERPATASPAGIQTLAPLVKQVMRTVVIVKATEEGLEAYPSDGPGYGFPDGPLPFTREIYGAGVIVDAGRGLVLTTGHVAKGADTSVLLSDGRRVVATVIMTDEESDLAILRIAATGLAAGPIASADSAEPGDFVLAIGDPLGLEHSVSFGIISALHRSWPDVSGRDLIQTDVLLERGSSGGPLFNLQGEIVGINIARALPKDGPSDLRLPPPPRRQSCAGRRKLAEPCSERKRACLGSTIANR